MTHVEVDGHGSPAPLRSTGFDAAAMVAAGSFLVAAGAILAPRRRRLKSE
jgi:hypothetical protein